MGGEVASVVGVDLQILGAEGGIDLLQRGEVELADHALVAVAERLVGGFGLRSQLAFVGHVFKVADAELCALAGQSVFLSREGCGGDWRSA